MTGTAASLQLLQQARKSSTGLSEGWHSSLSRAIFSGCGRAALEVVVTDTAASLRPFSGGTNGRTCPAVMTGTTASLQSFSVRAERRHWKGYLTCSDDWCSGLSPALYSRHGKAALQAVTTGTAASLRPFSAGVEGCTGSGGDCHSGLSLAFFSGQGRATLAAVLIPWFAAAFSQMGLHWRCL